MGLRDELVSGSKEQPCGVGKLLRVLPPDVAAELVELMDDLVIKHSQLEHLSKAKGWSGMSAGIIGRHRRKDCGCL
jgi:hypothetical protein